MEISLLAMDLDGTALLEDHKTFTPRLYAALSAAARKGVAIVPTTGRQYAMLPPAVHTGASCATAARSAAFIPASCWRSTISRRTLPGRLLKLPPAWA